MTKFPQISTVGFIQYAYNFDIFDLYFLLNLTLAIKIHVLSIQVLCLLKLLSLIAVRQTLKIFSSETSGQNLK